MTPRAGGDGGEHGGHITRGSHGPLKIMDLSEYCVAEWAPCLRG